MKPLWRLSNHSESGQALTEYLLLLTLTVAAATFLGKTAVRAMDKGVLRLGGQLEKDLKTGRAPASVWRN